MPKLCLGAAVLGRFGGVRCCYAVSLRRAGLGRCAGAVW